MKKDTWVVIANSSQARIFKLENLTLIEEKTLIHPESRLLERDIVQDKPGRVKDGSGMYPMQKPNTPKKTEAMNFAKDLADLLENARASGEIDRIFIASTPSFLGQVRQFMTELTKRIVIKEVDKDITHLKPEEIKEYFPIGL